MDKAVGGVGTQYPIDTLDPTGLPQMRDELQNGSVTRAYADDLERICEDPLIDGAWTPGFYGYDGQGSGIPARPREA